MNSINNWQTLSVITLFVCIGFVAGIIVVSMVPPISAAQPALGTGAEITHTIVPLQGITRGMGYNQHYLVITPAGEVWEISIPDQEIRGYRIKNVGSLK